MDYKSQYAQKLFEAGYLQEKQLEDIKEYRSLNIFSLNLELRLLLYAGILSLTTGFGILVYKNIDTIGHSVIITLIGLACMACFIWCFRNAKSFTKEQVMYDNPFFDYVLLSACLLAGIFTGYLQFQYEIFGNHYGLATLFPTLLYFFCAYYFDHRGVLSLGITGLGAWLGLSVSPTDLFSNSFMYSPVYDYTGIGLGVALVLYTIYATRERIKVHFNFTYLNFALHLLFLSSLSGLFTQSFWILFLIPITVTALYFFRLAESMPSFNFLLFTTVYSYIAFTYLVFKLTESMMLTGLMFSLIPLYFILSCVVIISWLIRFRKKIKT